MNLTTCCCPYIISLSAKREREREREKERERERERVKYLLSKPDYMLALYNQIVSEERERERESYTY